MKINESVQYKAHKLIEMFQTEAWQTYETFINDYICQYIESSLPRDQLIGMKKAVTAVKKFAADTINNFEN